MRKRHLMAALAAIGSMIGIGSAAEAGEWRLDPWRCPDLREDIRDARHDYGRRDRREDRIDRRYTDCPDRAWVYYGNYRNREYRYGPPRYQNIVFRNGQLMGQNRHGYFRIALINQEQFWHQYRHTRHNDNYRQRPVRRNAHYDRDRDERYDRRDRRHDDRYDRNRDRRDEGRDRRRDR